uniref:Uncharacterized protein n=1 Tax=Parascaris univalens TaxID=6257 RepID=A0A914ZSZ8_PARUN
LRRGSLIGCTMQSMCTDCPSLRISLGPLSCWVNTGFSGT